MTSETFAVWLHHRFGETLKQHFQEFLDAGVSAGGTPGGSDKQIQFNDAGVFGGDPSLIFNKTALPVPSSPTIVTTGTPGSTTYGYQISWYNEVGHSIGSAEHTIATGNATLNGTNYNVITAPASPPAGVLGFSVWRSTGGNQSYVGSATIGNSVNDQGGFADGATAPNSDESVGLGVTKVTLGDPVNGIQMSTDGPALVALGPGGQGGIFVGTVQGTAWGGGFGPVLQTSVSVVDAGEFGWALDCTSGIQNVNLPSAIPPSSSPSAGGIPRIMPGQIFWLKKTDTSANAATFTPHGSETIDGVAGVFSLRQKNESIMIQSDAGFGPTGNWQIINHYIPYETMPTADPHIVGRPWLSSGAVKVSAG